MVRYGNGDERTAKPTERFRLKIRNIPFPLSSVNYALRRVGGIMNNDIPPPFTLFRFGLWSGRDVVCRRPPPFRYVNYATLVPLEVGTVLS